MGQKFFISFNAADRTKAHWVAWILKDAGHEVAVYDWQIPAGGNAPLWMNTKLAWADRCIAVISPEYVRARYSPMEWASQIWSDPDGTKGAVIPVLVKPTSKLPPLLDGLRRIDLTNCSEIDAKRRLIEGVDIPAPPPRKPEFAQTKGEPPDSQEVGPTNKPTFVQVDAGVSRSLKPSGILALIVLAAFAAAAAVGNSGKEVSVAGVSTGIVMGAIAGVALLLFLRPAFINALRPPAPVIAIGQILPLTILIAVTILSLLAITFGGRWMSTLLLQPQDRESFSDCYILSLTLMWLLIIAYPVSQWILKLGRTIAGLSPESP
jgi:hypothetical protein